MVSLPSLPSHPSSAVPDSCRHVVCNREVQGTAVQFTTKEGAEVTVDAPDSRTAESIAQAVAEASRQAVAASSPATPTMTTPEQPPRGSRASPAASGERSQGWYKVLQRSVVRAGVEMDSPKRGETEVQSHHHQSYRSSD